MATQSIWDRYSDLSPDELRPLVTAAAQTLADAEDDEHQATGDVLQESPRSLAQHLTPILQARDPSLTTSQIQMVLEDDDLATEVSRYVLDEIRMVPELAERVAEVYEERRQKMVGLELILLAGALVVLAMRIKRLRVGRTVIDFEPAGNAVSTFVGGLAKSVGG